MLTADHTTPERRQASAELIAATRQLMLAAATTDLGVGTMRTAQKSIGHLVQMLGAQTRNRVVRAPFDGPATSRAAGPGQLWTLFTHNPMGYPLPISFEADSAHARIVADALCEGPHDSLHGGFAAHMMDCMLGTLLQARGQRAVTATLDLRYLRRTPLDEPLDLFSRIVETSGRKIIAEGWIEHDGIRTLEARGLFVSIDGEAQ